MDGRSAALVPGTEKRMSALYRRMEASCRVRPGKRVRLRTWNAAATFDLQFGGLRGADRKQRAKQLLDDNHVELDRMQELLWASGAYSVLVVLQGMDTAGKDGIIKHVMQGINPQACDVHRFTAPTDDELAHNFLWRSWQRLPARGHIGIFNRSYYEEVLIVRVHEKLLAAERLPPASLGRQLWKNRYSDINHFERHLARNGTLVLKFFLNLSKGEQKRRLLERLEHPDKRWKFSAADLEERGYWNDYVHAYEAMLSATSTSWAPWYVIPADHKDVARAVVATILAGQIEALGLSYPVVTPAEARRLAADKRRLLGSGAARKR
jgi:PPK2 family polyphosphate:nucleotide phosphotransferase